MITGRVDSFPILQRHDRNKQPGEGDETVLTCCGFCGEEEVAGCLACASVARPSASPHIIMIVIIIIVFFIFILSISGSWQCVSLMIVVESGRVLPATRPTANQHHVRERERVHSRRLLRRYGVRAVSWGAGGHA